MKAIEAAEHSDMIYDQNNTSMFFQVGEKWINEYGDVVQLNNISSDTYVPFVHKKIYKVGDQVTFLEALNSGMCFHLRNESPVQKFDGKLKLFNRLKKEWAFDDMVHVNGMVGKTYTLCEDPSIPPKPTLESLPAWTRCKVVLGCAIFDVVKMPGTGGTLFYRDKYGILTNSTDNRVKLLSVYNPKTEQWEDV